MADNNKNTSNNQSRPETRSFLKRLMDDIKNEIGKKTPLSILKGIGLSLWFLPVSIASLAHQTVRTLVFGEPFGSRSLNLNNQAQKEIDADNLDKRANQNLQSRQDDPHKDIKQDKQTVAHTDKTKPNQAKDRSDDRNTQSGGNSNDDKKKKEPLIHNGRQIKKPIDAFADVLRYKKIGGRLGNNIDIEINEDAAYLKFGPKKIEIKENELFKIQSKIFPYVLKNSSYYYYPDATTTIMQENTVVKQPVSKDMQAYMSAAVSTEIITSAFRLSMWDPSVIDAPEIKIDSLHIGYIDKKPITIDTWYNKETKELNFKLCGQAQEITKDIGKLSTDMLFDSSKITQDDLAKAVGVICMSIYSNIDEIDMDAVQEKAKDVLTKMNIHSDEPKNNVPDNNRDAFDKTDNINNASNDKTINDINLDIDDFVDACNRENEDMTNSAFNEQPDIPDFVRKDDIGVDEEDLEL